MKKKVGVIGSGVVGRTLADGFIKHGCQVMIGTRHPEKLHEWNRSNGPKGLVGTFEAAAQFGDLIVLAAQGGGAESAVKMAGVENLAGKTILDATNPIDNKPPTNGVLHYFTSFEESLMERLQRIAPEARFVKAFSCVGSMHMVNPDFGGLQPTMFICGDSEEAKHEASEVCEMFGFDVYDMGGVEGARAIEPLAMLFCIPGFLRNEWMHAFKVLKK
jgi:hypothetical protein